MRKYLIILMSLAVLSGCKRELGTESDDMEVTVQSTFVSPTGEAWEASTRASSTAFADGDLVGLYMVNFNDQGERVPLATTGNQEDNVMFTSNSSGTLTTTPPIRYKKDYKGKLDLYAYYPYDAKMLEKDVNAYEFAIKGNQGTGITTSDFCRSRTKDEGIVPTSAAVALKFDHMLSKIEVTLNMPRDYKENLKIKRVSNFFFMGVQSSVTVDMGAGTLTNNDTRVEALVPFVVDQGVVSDIEADSRPYKCEMIAPAQTFDIGKRFIRVIVEFENGAVEPFEFKVIGGLFGDNNTKAGKVHKLAFSVDPGLELKFEGVTIEPWNTGTGVTGEVDGAITTVFSVSQQEFEPSFANANRVKVTTDDGKVYDIQTGVTVNNSVCSFSFNHESGAPRNYGFRIVGLEFLNGGMLLYSQTLLSKRVYSPVAMDLGTLPFSGAGTAESPYLIGNAAELNNVRILNGPQGDGVCFKQTADIDLGPHLPIKFASAAADGSALTFAENTARKRPYMGNNIITGEGNVVVEGDKTQGGWIPIGHSETGGTPVTVKFLGNYDGAGYVIKNLCINRPNLSSSQGLFGCIIGTGTYKNITTQNFYIASSMRVGSIVGIVEGKVTIKNCVSQSGVITAEGGYDAAGVVGMILGGTKVIGCGNGATIYSASRVIGGVVGANFPGVIEGCYNVGSVTGLAGAGGIYALGGVFEGETNDPQAHYSYNRGTVAGANIGAIFISNSKEGLPQSHCYWLTGIVGYVSSTTAVIDFAALTESAMKNTNQNDPTSLLYKLNKGTVKWVIAPAGHWNAGWPIPNPATIP